MTQPPKSLAHRFRFLQQLRILHKQIYSKLALDHAFYKRSFNRIVQMSGIFAHYERFCKPVITANDSTRLPEEWDDVKGVVQNLSLLQSDTPKLQILSQ